MDKGAIKNAILSRKISILIIVALLVLVAVLFSKTQDYKFTLFYQYQAIPDIELKNTLQESQSGLFGEVRGFVRFDDTQDQPKDLRQYYVIKPLNRFEQDLSQYFSIEEIVKMRYLPPRSMGVSELVQTKKTDRAITLQDEEGNQYFINRATKEVSIKDSAGENTVLITKDSDYRDFMKSWLLE